jgi:hypothetical protein
MNIPKEKKLVKSDNKIEIKETSGPAKQFLFSLIKNTAPDYIEKTGEMFADIMVQVESLQRRSDDNR